MTGPSLRERLASVEPPPRLVDWSLLVCVLVEFGSGVLSLGAGYPGNWPVFYVHSVVGVAFVFLLFFKLRRVRTRVTDSRLWDRATALSVLTATVAVTALATGAWWVLGGNARVLTYWNLMNLHVGLGLVLLPLVVAHLATRFRPPRRTDFEGRRTALRYGALLLGGALLFRAQELLAAAAETPGQRRFTGSKPVEADGLSPEGEVGDGNASFPVTSWVADDPDPVDRENWRLRVGGLTDSTLELSADELAPDAERRVLLDCTSGWYAERDWRGIRLDALLEAVGPDDDARWVTVHSVTGYRWSFPIEEAREMLLATHVGGERLAHGHGFPLRLVAPNRRGFQWIKWVDGVEVRRRRDAAQWTAVLVSGLG
ncbi:Oxidoreductase molybdopterin binding domain-containing protein [Halopelagius inordinatus]|uniref:Oxidoreductase molybdopterin binding domain-containing protein n=1 Tax=Halopelagius inordinatus TaxID=553467 RepID=A0A1I2MGD6_9EURY|nr:molybdopterin-dependent oxidoreductase [Halopelagius inordinatus]SFF90575.1 Oxidoreductase molybdopterin binding domain-containing protein [Halopelagius inordinatus]